MKKAIGITSALLFPSLALAATGIDLSGISDTVRSLIYIVNLLIPFFLAIAVLVFIYGLIKYVLQAGESEARKEARGCIIYGIIGIAVIMSVFGLVKLLQNTLDIQNDNPTGGDIPQVPGGAL
mgnify:CR=1 FL=1